MATDRLVGGRYELGELVGAGGMSSVYKAHDRVLERDVALKILHPHFTHDGEYVERFRREARAVAQLSHPNIVTVIDRGEDSGQQFIVFELVDGQSLKEVVDKAGPLPVEDALRIAFEIARALAFAHENGIVHRDVKPQNVLLNGDGRPKVTDFGIARSLEVDGVTQTGTVLGTSNYIAPEQASGTGVSAQTDVYSLGVVLFELLTGRVPFEGDNFVQIAMQHVNQPPPDVRALRPDVPPRVAAAVERALRKDPSERFASMTAFAAELEACLAELDGSAAMPQTMIVPPTRAGAPLPTPPRTRWWPILLGLLVVGALVAVLVGILGGRGGGSASGSSTQAPPPSRPVHFTGVAAYDPYGDRHEHDESVAAAADGNAGTFWQTEHYDGGLGKQGVGVVLDAHRSVRPTRIGIATDTPGFTASIRAGDSETGPFHQLAAAKTVNEQTFFSVHATRAWRYWVVWITDLGPNSSAHVNEVVAR